MAEKLNSSFDTKRLPTVNVTFGCRAPCVIIRVLVPLRVCRANGKPTRIRKQDILSETAVEIVFVDRYVLFRMADPHFRVRNQSICLQHVCTGIDTNRGIRTHNLAPTKRR